MPILGPDDPLPRRPQRVLIAGTSGSGKTTAAIRVSEVLQVPHVEIDALFHGPRWTPRPDFEAEVQRFSATPAWATEWQYGQVRPQLAERSDLMVWLDLSRVQVMQQVLRRTLQRRLRRQVLWNGNVEPPLWRFFTDSEHVVRWAWSTHHETPLRIAALQAQHPGLIIVRLRTRVAIERWVEGPLREAATRTIGTP